MTTSKHVRFQRHLLQSAIPHIRQHGFTVASILASSQVDEKLVRSHFPGPPSSKTSPERSLFRAWDVHQLHRRSSEQSQGANSLGNGKGRNSAYQETVSLLAERLLESWKVREHLSNALALESSLASLPLASALMPFLSNHSSENKLKEICLPTPLPLLKRSGKIVEGSLDLTGFRNTEEIGPEWYTVRGKLSLGYLASELHLLSPNLSSPDASLSLFHRITSREAGAEHEYSSEIKGYLEVARDWTQWGGRGWLGILRSWGL